VSLCLIVKTQTPVTGNGTQSIAWKINAETYRKRLEDAARRAAGIPDDDQAEGLQIYYGSMHDILSYPCEVRTVNSQASNDSHPVLRTATRP
jgi:hypothetical protein